MSPGFVKDLNTFLAENLKAKKRFFYYRGLYRTFSWSFKEIYDNSRKFTVLLSSLRLKKGDRVVIRSPNQLEWVITYIGCIFSGIVIVPLDINSSIEFLIKVLKKTEAKALIIPKLSPDYDRVLSRFSRIEIIELDGLEQRLSSLSTADLKLAKPADDDLLEIVFTSGTTDDPKGVMITRGNLQSNLGSVAPVMARWKKFFRLMVNLKILSVIPLSHMYGQLMGVFIPLMIDSSMVFMESINPRDITKTIKKEKIWILGTLPRILDMIKDHINPQFGFDTPGFKKKFNRFSGIKWPLRFLAFLNIHLKLGWRFVAIIVGGAAFDKKADEFWRCIAYTIFQGYGLTETAPLITLADPSQSRAGYIGRVLEGQEVKLVDGEILVKGSNVSPGYYKDIAKTRSAFKNGWFRTGDLVEMGENGNLVFKGRKDEVIVRSDGINIYPGDIESVLNSFKAIKDSAVLGIQAKGGFEIYAVLLLAEDFTGLVDNIIDRANKKLNVYQHINKYIIWQEEDFPRTSTGKARKKLIGKRLPALAAGKTVHIVNGDLKERKIFNILKEFKKMSTKKLRRDSQLEKDLGLDSLDLIQLAGVIEQKYDIDIDDAVISGESTLEEIEKVIEKPERSSYRFPFYNFPFWLPVRLLRNIFQYILYPFIRIIYRPEVIGIENLKDIEGPVIFAANHSSNLDTFAVLYGLPLKIRQKVATLMSIEYHFNHFFYHTGPWWRRFLEAIGFYLLVNLFISICPLSRTHGFRQVMENIGSLLDKGWSILIYPEGRVTPDGKIKEFESGIGVIAADMKVQVIPVKIDGLYNILKNGVLPWGHWPRWPRVKVNFGKAIDHIGKDHMEITRAVYRKVKSF